VVGDKVEEEDDDEEEASQGKQRGWRRTMK